MKKILKISLVIGLLLLINISNVEAVVSSQLADKLYSMGARYGLTASHKLQIERYLSDYPVTEEEANAIISKANEAIAIMEESGITDIKQLSSADKNKIVSLANEAANIVGVTLKFNSDSVSVYKDGKLINQITSEAASGKLAYTGNNIYKILVVSSVAIALIAIIYNKEKKANA